jgi:hypothetical protein
VIVPSPTRHILSRKWFCLAYGRWSSIVVNKAVLVWVVRDGRIVVEGNNARPAASFNKRAGSAHWRRCSNETAAKRIALRRFYGFPFLST